MATYECLMPHCRAEVYRRRDVCEDCWEDRRPQLDALPELYVMTYALMIPGSSLQWSEIGNIHVAKPESGVPFSLVIFDALESVAVLDLWAEWVRAKLGHPHHDANWITGRRLTEAVSFLQIYDHKLATSDFVGDYVLDVWTVYRRLVVQCQPTAPRHLDVICPTCDNATVLTRHADEFAACLTCRTIWPHSRLSSLGSQVA